MNKLLAIATLSLCTLAVAAPSQAQHRQGSSGGAVASGRAVPRGGAVAPAIVSPRVVVGSGYRPYYYPRYSLGFGFGYGYPYYSPYYYPYGYYGSSFGYGGYPYGYGTPYGYGAPYAYGGNGNYAVEGGAARGYGSVRITDAPKDAQVYADGYYVGAVDDFDGTFQHMNLEAGTHHVEIREKGQAPISFDVNVRPGESITYHAK